MKYIKKQIIIDAAQWIKFGDVDGIKQRKVPEHFNSRCSKCGHFTDEHGDIETLEGKNGAQEVCPGDYIITGINGERYPCKPDIFIKTYDKF